MLKTAEALSYLFCVEKAPFGRERELVHLASGPVVDVQTCF
jgi:hypothetical protein